MPSQEEKSRKHKHDRYWTDNAERYDSSISFVDRKFLASSRAWVAERASGKTLEIALGTGLNLQYYPQITSLTGLEQNRPMLQMALQKAALQGRTLQISQGDAMQLPFADESFDTVLCTFALCGISDEKQALREMHRVLKPGGRLLLADHVVSTWPPLAGLQWLLERYSLPAHGEHFRRRPLPIVKAMPFEIIETQRLSFGIIERVHARKLA